MIEANENSVFRYIPRLVADETEAKITNDIIDIVAPYMQQRKLTDLGPLTMEPIFEGIAGAYVVLALATHGTETAKVMLVELADLLDDPEQFKFIAQTFF